MISSDNTSLEKVSPNVMGPITIPRITVSFSDQLRFRELLSLITNQMVNMLYFWSCEGLPMDSWELWGQGCMKQIYVWSSFYLFVHPNCWNLESTQQEIALERKIDNGAETNLLTLWTWWFATFSLQYLHFKICVFTKELSFQFI